MAETHAQPDQWWSAFPEPRAKAPKISVDEVMQMFDDMDITPEPRSFLLVDVRRTDWVVSSLFSQLQDHLSGLSIAYFSNSRG